MANIISSESNYPRKFWKESDEIDHLNFGSLINGSKSSILDTPYKIAFRSSPNMYGGSQQVKGKKNFKLLKTQEINLSKLALGNYDSNIYEKMPALKGSFVSMTNLDNQNALVVLKQLLDVQVIGGYDFSETLTGEVLLTVSFERKGDLQLETLSFSHLRRPKDSVPSTKRHLASLALEALMDSRKCMDDDQKEKGTKTRWCDMTFKGITEYLKMYHVSVQSTAIVPVNPENQNSLVVIKQLSDVGMIQSYEFIETPASDNCPEKISLSVSMGVSKSQGKLSKPSSQKLVPTQAQTMLFERYRTTEAKKWIRQDLVSTALDSMIAERTSNKDDLKLNWYDLPYKELRDRIEGRNHC